MGGLLLAAPVAEAAEPSAAPPHVYACEDGATIQDISLKDAVASAYSGHPQLVSARQDVEKSKAAITGAMTGFLPSASVSMVGEHFVSYAPGAAPVAVGTSIVGGQTSVFTSYPSLGVNWNLFNGGKDLAGYRGAEAGMRASEGDLSDKTLSGLSMVLSAYGDLLKAQSSARQQAHAVDLLRQILDSVEFRFRQGRENLLTVDQARLTLAQNERAYFESCKALSDKSAAVFQAIGARLGAVQLLRAVAEGLPDPPEAQALASSFEAVVEQEPAVKAARERVEAAQNKLEQARGAFKPTVAFFGRYDGLGQSPASLGDAYNATHRNSLRVGITLQQSLGPFTSEYAALESARADSVKADAAYQAALIDADNRLRSAWNGKRQSSLASQAAQRSAEHASQTRRVTEQLFERGRVTQDAIVQSTVMAERELQAAKERDLDDRVQGWLLYRAVKPREFGEKLVGMFVGMTGEGGVDFQKRQ